MVYMVFSPALDSKLLYANHDTLEKAYLKGILICSILIYFLVITILVYIKFKFLSLL